ncbi:MAG: hypothetical protein AVDCRST_MAG19-649 [uncultured Thermomicrobiales bacterium]|uniref:Ferric uptake regulation protein FUR n=1 Tax=uncultured Thermomicrobiales bacterium TaxID=1645740 RepID=A0A6J4UJL3_9BACT|nr:MAG: hypothetical protein AVDCRST_MAG19-649 [uncultured Thermomicrobiales bacterium]
MGIEDVDRGRWYTARMQRQTAQRHAILDTIRQAAGPLSIPQIHARASQDAPGLGLATVYRTVKLLLATEHIVAVDFPGEEPHYEPIGRGHHHHFRCLSCDHWFELDRCLGCLVAIPDGTTLPDGFVVEAHHLTLYGRCPRCAAEPNPTASPA